MYAAFNVDSAQRLQVFYDQVSDMAFVPYETTYKKSREDQFPLQPFVEKPPPEDAQALISINDIGRFSRNFIYWRPNDREIPAAFYINIEPDKLKLTVGEPSMFVFRIEILRPPGNDWVMPDHRALTLEYDVAQVMDKAVTSLGTIIPTPVNLVWYTVVSGVIKDKIPKGTKILLVVDFPAIPNGYVQLFMQMVVVLANLEHSMYYRVVNEVRKDSLRASFSGSSESFGSLEIDPEAAGSWDRV